MTVVIDPADYSRVLAQMDQGGSTSYALRLELAAKVYSHTAAYDGAIAAYLTSLAEAAPAQDAVPARNEWPGTLTIQVRQEQALRYGENPHQTAAFYVDAQRPAGLLGNYRQLQGKELSYNNIADADAAWECVRSFDSTACVIVKHANPCGVAIGDGTLHVYQQAFKTDPTSAFGGIIAFNRPVDAATAEAVSGQFLEVLLAPPTTARRWPSWRPRRTYACWKCRPARARMPSTSSAWAAAGWCRARTPTTCRATR